MPIIGKRAPRKRFLWIKWSIRLRWIGLKAATAVRAGGYGMVNPTYQIDGGPTLLQSDPPWFAVYYVILALFLIPVIVLGRRAACHSICWMAPFMILGRKVRKLLRWPALRLTANEEACIDCNRCTQAGPMSLKVNALVHQLTLEHSECILCGRCVDTCPTDAIHYTFGAGR